VASISRRTPEGAQERPGEGAGHAHAHPEAAADTDASGVVFAGLAKGGRFFQDTRLGAMFHPGKVSLREVCKKDSLHVSVGEDNRVSVHVDRYSPLSERMRGNRSRYSVVRVVVHNLGVLADVVVSTVRRSRGQQRCELECVQVWVDEEDGVVAVAEQPADEVAGSDPAAQDASAGGPSRA
jgi:hypothetical protein